MTILNQNKNVSEDYVFLVTMDEIFYAYEDLPYPFYNYQNDSWLACSDSPGANLYNSIEEYIKDNLVNFENQFGLVDMEQDFSSFFSESENGFYIGVSKINQNQKGYPNDTTDIGHSFMLIKANDSAAYIPIKTLPLYNMKIVDTDYIIGDNEYVSALYAKTLITKGIEDLKIFEILNAGSTNTLTYLNNNVSSPKTNIIYFVKKNSDSSDGLNITFDLYSYNNEWVKLDNLTLNVNDIPPKNHASSATTYGVGTSSNYGHVKVANNLTTSSFSSSGPVVLSAYQGKLLNDNLSNKQDTLVSGTNIKTLNSTTLLGSGNINVQTPLVSGTNIKTINNQSLLGAGNLTVVTDISGKQDLLVSGTNIKTINNQSLLGSGNIQVSANADMSNYYTKTEIDTMIGDIQDYIYS